MLVTGVAGGDSSGATLVGVSGLVGRGPLGANDHADDVTVTVVVGAIGPSARTFDAHENVNINVNVTAAAAATGISLGSFVARERSAAIGSFHFIRCQQGRRGVVEVFRQGE